MSPIAQEVIPPKFVVPLTLTLHAKPVVIPVTVRSGVFVLAFQSPCNIIAPLIA